MATKSEIKYKIEHTRNEISNTIDEIGHIVHNKLDIKSQIEKKPYSSLLIAAAVGFSIATISTPFSKKIMKVFINSAKSTLTAYISQKGLNFFSNSLQSK